MAGPGFFQDTGGASVEHRIPLDKTIYFLVERDLGDAGTETVNLDFTTGNKMKVTLTGSPTFTFTDPYGATNLILRLVHSGAGTHTVTWPANVKTPGGLTYNLSVGDGKIDIVALYFDGTDYYLQTALDYS